MFNHTSLCRKINNILSLWLFRIYKIDLLNFFNKSILGLDEGVFAYHEIKKLLSKNVFIVLDFEGIIFYENFIQYAICKHLEYLSKDDLYNNLLIINISENNLKYIKNLVENSEKYWKDVQYRDWLHDRQYVRYEYSDDITIENI